jgi:hypothetical protein
MIQHQANATTGVNALKRLLDIVRMQNESGWAGGAGTPHQSVKLFRLLAGWNSPQSVRPLRHDLPSPPGSISRTRCDRRQKNKTKE